MKNGYTITFGDIRLHRDIKRRIIKVNISEISSRMIWFL